MIVVRFVGYEIECEICGIIDTATTKRAANVIRREHLEQHEEVNWQEKQT